MSDHHHHHHHSYHGREERYEQPPPPPNYGNYGGPSPPPPGGQYGYDQPPPPRPFDQPPPPHGYGSGYGQPPPPGDHGRYQSGGGHSQGGSDQSAAIFAENQRLKLLEEAGINASKHKTHEHLGELGAVAAGAFALYEAHKSKSDLEHAGRHKMEASIAGAAAAGSAGYAVYEHIEKKKTGHIYEGSGKHHKH